MATKYRHLKNFFVVYDEDTSVWGDASHEICKAEDRNNVFGRMYWRVNARNLIVVFRWRKIENGLVKSAHEDTRSTYPLEYDNENKQSILIDMFTKGMFCMNSNYSTFPIPTEREEMLLHWHAYVRWLGKNKNWEIIP